MEREHDGGRATENVKGSQVAPGWTTPRDGGVTAVSRMFRLVTTADARAMTPTTPQPVSALGTHVHGRSGCMQPPSIRSWSIGIRHHLRSCRRTTDTNLPHPRQVTGEVICYRLRQEEVGSVVPRVELQLHDAHRFCPLHCPPQHLFSPSPNDVVGVVHPPAPHTTGGDSVCGDLRVTR